MREDSVAAAMIEKLRSRGPIDVPMQWTRRPGIISGALLLTGAVTLGALAGAVAYAGILSWKNAVLIALGGGSLLVAFAVLSFVATRQDL